MTRKRLIFKTIPEENTLSASNEKDFVLIDVTPLCRRIHLIICFYQAHYIHYDFQSDQLKFCTRVIKYKNNIPLRRALAKTELDQSVQLTTFKSPKFSIH